MSGILRMLHLASATGEDAADRMRRRVSQTPGTTPTRRIVAYQKHSGPETVHLSGRVLSRSPGGAPLDDEG